MAGQNTFGIAEKLKLSTVPREEIPKKILTMKDGIVGFVTLDSTPRLGSGSLMSSDSIYKAIRDGVSSGVRSTSASGGAPAHNLQVVTNIGNFTNQGIEFRNAAASAVGLLSVDDTTGHTKFDLTVDKRLEANGDIVAYGDGTSPGGSWWDDMPIATDTILGGVKEGTNITIDPDGTINGTAAGTTDHGGLTGLTDDDHTQYFNQARGDARYALSGHNHSEFYWSAATGGIHYSSGNVGIGTTSQTFPFHVHSTDGNSRIVITDDVTTDAVLSGLTIGLNSSQAPFIWNYENTDLSFATNGAVRMVLEAGGDLEIGSHTANAPILKANESSTYCNLEVTGVARGSYWGLKIGGSSDIVSEPTLMYSSNGAGGIYYQGGSDWAILTRYNAEVEIKYNGSTKLETATDGVDVTGALRATGDVVAYST
jgi:hypothetical protein